ncbi:MAG TPA: 30S ribosomal protein S2 [Clostridiales bacterium]|mgnify:CR=1 FL=1|nr:30S ribosomal protein S2 [Clostridiales bacterium]
MAIITMKQLLEAGVHFGHQTKRWNPKMKPYIYGARNDIHIIDLQITAQEIEKAFKFVYESVQNGATVLFVGKKKQAKDAIQSEAERCGMFYMNNRWLGGTLTNFETIKTRIDKLHKLDQSEKMGEFEQYSKKEAMKLRQQKEKLENDLGGIKNMRKLPDIMFVVDLKNEETAIKEARKLNIPIIGLVDTNCDPDLVDFVIPGNDDAIRAIKLIAGVIADAVIAASEGVDYVEGSVTGEAFLASSEENLASETEDENLNAEAQKIDTEVKEDIVEKDDVTEAKKAKKTVSKEKVADDKKESVEKKDNKKVADDKQESVEKKDNKKVDDKKQEEKETIKEDKE